MNSAKIIATQIRLHKDKKTLFVSFNDGFMAQLSAELLSQLVMGQTNNSPAMNILRNWYLKNLKS